MAPMEIKPEQIPAQVQQGLAPIYLIHGEELLIAQEAADAVRAAARAQGFSTREVFEVDRDFDWNRLLGAADALSLFAERRILEVRIPGGKPGREGGEALRAYAERPPQDDLLLVLCGKLEAAQRKSRWFKALDQAGVTVAAWPVEAGALPRWIRARMRSRGLEPTPEAVQALAERVEGNLLAAAQEIDKLLLLHGPGAVDERAVAAVVADSARFDVFDLVDAALAGDAGRCQRTLSGLKAEGVEPVLVSWALARELRSLSAMAWEVARGEPAAAVMRRHRVWSKRQGPVGSALQRFRPPVWHALLARAAFIDRVIKGQAPGNPWDELIQLCLALAGTRLGIRTA